MPVKHFREEAGYSLMEVMASILILALAILPMAGMFDMGLETATTGSNYDKGRTLANLKMEEAKSLPFGIVRDNFPEPAGTPTPYDLDSGSSYESAWKDVTGPADAEFTNFQYMVKKQYMKQPPTGVDPLEDPSGDFLPCTIVNDCTPPSDLIRITVTVKFPNDSGASPRYTTVGLVTG